MSSNNSYTVNGNLNLGFVPDNFDTEAPGGGDEDDPWKVTHLSQDFTPWEELTGREKLLRSVGYVVKAILALATMYLFICSLDFLSSAFKLLGGEAAGKVFQQSEIFTNPIAGVMMGVLVTVLVQSSSTSTSIVVSMVGGGLLDIQTAIPIVMGANIGTSVTNTIVSMGQISDKSEFRRAFAGATVHDMFNWLTVIVLLPLEVATGYLYKISGLIVDQWRDDPQFMEGNKGAKKDILKVITKPFTKLIIQINKNAITDIAQKKDAALVQDGNIMKVCCDKTPPAKCCQGQVKAFGKMTEFSFLKQKGNYTNQQMLSVCDRPELASCVDRDNVTSAPHSCLSAWTPGEVTHTLTRLDCSRLGVTSREQLACDQWFDARVPGELPGPSPLLPTSINLTAVCDDVTSLFNSTVNCTGSWQNVTHRQTYDSFSCPLWARDVEEKTCNNKCDFLFSGLHPALNDKEIGGILLVVSLALLCACLVTMVKLLHSLLQGPMATLIKKFVNADFPGCCGYFTGYLAILVGAGLTVVVQSSSIFTSTLTPLVGMGVIEVDRMYPLTVGSNIGTTTTAILSSLANSGQKLLDSLQVSLCHLLFNISGILLFYPIPFTRFPIPMAKFLGERTANYRWFAVVYILAMFFLLPGMVFALSIPGWWVLLAVMGPFALFLLLVAVIKILQNKCPGCLPEKMSDFKWLPLCCRSLEPFDRLMRKVFFCRRFQQQKDADDAMFAKATKNTAM